MISDENQFYLFQSFFPPPFHHTWVLSVFLSLVAWLPEYLAYLLCRRHVVSVLDPVISSSVRKFCSLKAWKTVRIQSRP